MKCLNKSNKEINKMIESFGEVQTSLLLDKFPENIIPTFEEVEELFLKSPQVNYQFKAVEIISRNLDKIRQWESNKSINQETLFKKIQELGVPKEQLIIFHQTFNNLIEKKFQNLQKQCT